MPAHCSAPDCTNRADNSRTISFHRFPTDRPNILEIWLRNIGRPNFVPCRSSRLCSDHFTPSCFIGYQNRRILKDDAVPDNCHPSTECSEMLPNYEESSCSAADEDDCTENIPASVKLEPATVDADVVNVHIEQEQPEDGNETRESHHECHADILLQSLYELQQRDIMCDTILLAKDGHVKVHGAVLAAASPVFQTSLLSQPKPTERVMFLPTVELYIVEVIVRLVYSGEIVVPEQYALPDCLSKVLSTIRGLGVKMPSASKSFDVSEIITQMEANFFPEEKEQISSEPDTNDDSQILPVNDVVDATDQVENEANLIQSVKDSTVRSGFHLRTIDNIKLTNVYDETYAGSKSRLQKAGALSTGGAGENGSLQLLCEEHRQSPNDARLYGCLECGRRFSQRSHLTRHQKIHGTTCAFLCQVCGRGFCRKTALLYHSSTHRSDANDDRFACHICSESFANLYRLQYHIRRYHKCRKIERDGTAHGAQTPSETYRCAICDRQYPTERRWKSHQKCCPEAPRPYVCQFCPRSFAQLGQFAAHLSIEHSSGCVDPDNLTLSCEWCSETFLNEHQLTYHLRMHQRETLVTGNKANGDAEKPQKCTQCGRVLKNRRCFEQHLRTHSAEKNFLCQYCGRAFRLRAALLAHSTIHYREIYGREPDPDMYRCKVCEESFVNVYRLRYHVRHRHNPNLKRRVRKYPQKFACPLCERNFNTLQILLVHTRRHTGEKPLICEVCGSSFRQPSGLIQHRLTHDRSRQFVCVTCGRQFLQKRYYKEHLQTHSSGSLYVCQTCGKQFLSRSSFKTHERGHMNISRRTFVCEACGKYFARASHLRSHIKRHKRNTEEHVEQQLVIS